MRGDPWLRSQRLFTVIVQILLSMTMASVFFQHEDLLEGGICETDHDWCEGKGSIVVNGSASPCCEEENGILASLLTMACALPLIGAVNIAFGLLRRPFEADAMSKSGEQSARLKEKASKPEKKQRRKHRYLKRLARWAAMFGKCVKVQCRCVAKLLRKPGVDVSEQDSESGDEANETTDRRTGASGTKDIPDAPRQRAAVCPRRKQVSQQMRVSSQAICLCL